MPEHYIHPPLVAAEASSARFARWRYRLVALLLLLILTIAVVYAFLQISGVTAEDPGLGGALRPATVQAAR